MRLIKERILVWCLLVLISSNSVAVSLYSFDYANGVAYLQVNSDLGFKRSIKYLRQDDVVLKVNFLEEEYKNIYKGETVSWLSYSPRGRYIVFSDKKNIYLYDIDKDIKIKTIGGALKKRPYWSPKGGSVAMHVMVDQAVEEFLYEFDTQSENLLSVLFQKRRHDDDWISKGLWGVEWSSDCKCFLYEVSDSIENIEHQVVRVNGDELVPFPRRKSLFVSPDKTRYFVEAEYGDGEGEFTLRDYRTDKPVAELGWFTSSIYSYEMLWKGSVARVLGRPRWVIDINDGSFVESKVDLKKMRDVAVDSSGYILMWHEEKNRFFVQNIETMEIVKTYDAFWLTQSGNGSDNEVGEASATESESAKDVGTLESTGMAEGQNNSESAEKNSKEAQLVQHGVTERDGIATAIDASKGREVSESDGRSSQERSTDALTNGSNMQWYIIVLAVLVFGAAVFTYFRRHS